MNSLTIAGRLAADPLRSGTVALFQVVTGHGDRTELVALKAFGKTAENLVAHTAKGSAVAVTGHVRHTEHEGTWSTECVAERVTFLSPSTANGE